MSEKQAPKIHAAIIEVMRRVGFIGKTMENKEQKYKFRGIDQVYNAVQPALVEAGVVIWPRVVTAEYEDRQAKSGTWQVYVKMRMEYTAVCAEDGSSWSSEIVQEALDSSDKATGKCMSMAQKYFLFQLLHIPTEEQKDNEMFNHEIGEKGDRSAGEQPKEEVPPEMMRNLARLLEERSHGMLEHEVAATLELTDVNRIRKAIEFLLSCKYRDNEGEDDIEKLRRVVVGLLATRDHGMTDVECASTIGISSVAKMKKAIEFLESKPEREPASESKVEDNEMHEKAKAPRRTKQ